MFYTNWVATFRGDGQWASQPLISNEQFGIGGVNSVRGYHEGEEFGDTGWHFSSRTVHPAASVGTVYGNTPLILRGSVYMDIATVYLLDPLGRPPSTRTLGRWFRVYRLGRLPLGSPFSVFRSIAGHQLHTRGPAVF